MGRTPLGQLLLKDGRISDIQLRSAISHQTRWGGRIGQALVSMGYLSEQAMLSALATQQGVPFIELGRRKVSGDVLRLLPERLIRRRRVFPVELSGGRRGPLVIACTDPADLGLIDELAFACGMQVRVALASELDIERAIARHFDGAMDEPVRAIDIPPDPGPMRLVNPKH